LGIRTSLPSQVVMIVDRELSVVMRPSTPSMITTSLGANGWRTLSRIEAM